MNYANQINDANEMANQSGETGEQLRERLRVAPRTFQKRWKSVLGYAFSSRKICTIEEIEKMEDAYSAKGLKRVETRNNARSQPGDKVRPAAIPVKQEAELPETTTKAPPFSVSKRAILVIIMAAPALASVQNMGIVMNDIMHDRFAAVLLTITFAIAPFAFVLSGISGGVFTVLTGVLIGIEAFANTVRLYGGLTGFGATGNPTRFLGIVCELFNSGTYQTAVFMAVSLSIVAASVMYAAYFKLKGK